MLTLKLYECQYLHVYYNLLISEVNQNEFLPTSNLKNNEKFNLLYICESTIRTNELLTQQVSGLTVPFLPHHKRLVTSFTLIELCPIVILLEWQWFLLGNNTLKNRKEKWI